MRFGCGPIHVMLPFDLDRGFFGDRPFRRLCGAAGWVTTNHPYDLIPRYRLRASALGEGNPPLGLVREPEAITDNPEEPSLRIGSSPLAVSKTTFSDQNGRWCCALQLCKVGRVGLGSSAGQAFTRSTLEKEKGDRGRLMRINVENLNRIYLLGDRPQRRRLRAARHCDTSFRITEGISQWLRLVEATHPYSLRRSSRLSR